MLGRILFSLLLITGFSFSQIANFSLLKDSVCVGDTVVITNLSTSADTFLLDFSEERLEDLSLTSPKGIVSLPSSNSRKVRIIKNTDGNFYAFVLYWPGNTLTVYNLGNYPFDNNIVSSYNQSFPISSPYDFELKYLNGEYVLILGNTSGQIGILNYGNSLANTPTQINYGNFGGNIPNNFRNCDIIYKNGKYYIFTVNYLSAYLHIIELDSLTPTSPYSYQNISTVNGYHMGVAANVRNDTIDVFLNNYVTDKIQLIRFIGAINSTPTNSIVFNPANSASTSFNSKIEINREVKMLYSPLNGNNTHIYLGTFDFNIQKYTTKLLCSSCDFDFDILKYKGEYYIFWGTDSLYYKKFVENNNEGDTVFNSSANTINHVYNEPGKYYIQLLACTDTSGCTYKIDSIVVLAPPQMDIIKENACLGNEATITYFNPDNEIISQLTWDLGDGTIVSNQDTVRHIYNSGGKKYIQLSVENYFGCKDTIVDSVVVYNPPSASFSVNLPQCFAQPVIFNNTSTTSPGDSIIFNKWLFGNGETSTIPNPSYTYTTGGSYDVSLVVFSDKFCTDTTTQTITIPGITINYDSVCVNQPTTISFNAFYPNDNVNSFIWTIQQNTYNQNPLTYTFNNTGTFPIKLNVSTANGCNDSITKSITITQKPPINIYIESERCTNKPLLLKYTGTPQDAPVKNILWDFDVSTTTDDTYGSPILNSFPNAGDFQVKIIVSNIYGCKNDSFFTVKVTDKPTANFIINDTLCSNKTITLQNTSISTDTLRYLWLWNDGTISYKENPVWTPDTGTFYINLKAITSSNCADSITKRVVVNPSPTAIFTIYPADSQHIPFVVTSQNLGDSSNKYYWFIDDLFLSDSFEIKTTIDSVGEHSIALIAENQYKCYDTMQTKIVALPPIPEYLDIALLRAELVPDSSGNYYIKTIVHNKSNKPVTSWTFKLTSPKSITTLFTINDSLDVNQVKSVSIPIALDSLQLNASYYLCVEAVSPNGKSDAFPNDNKKCILFSSTSQVVRIYPNPFNRKITLEIVAVKDSKAKLILYSIDGKILKEDNALLTLGKNDIIFNAPEGLASSNYILLVDIEGKKFTFNITK